ncbi:MAG: penicillin acylase family protein [Rubrivivax sp.]
MRWRRWALWSLGGLLLLALLAAAGLWWWAQRSLPVVEGRLALPGLKAPLQIDRDTDGIPTIQAQSLRDLAYGLGVVHAQDRLWQLETHRRIGSGRLAEAFGPAALENDRFLRALGVRRAAAAQWARLSAPSRELLQAYADGVNATARQLRALPPEFGVLGLKFEDWQPEDSLAWTIMMAWDLGGNWSTELLRLRLALQMPVPRIQQLLPPYPGDEPLPVADYAALFRGLGLGSAAGTQTAAAWGRLPAQAPESGIEGVGSNNWVLAGQRSTTGKPLLANDPHLKLSAPALWYFARLQAPGLKVAGATMAGLPVVVLGQNEHLAWGFTNTAPDVQDLYIEEVQADRPSHYRTPEGWAPFETFSDTLRVKGQPDVTVTWRATRHGPVISDAGTVDDVVKPAGGTAATARHVLALRWTALDADVDPVTPAVGFMRAATVTDFVTAARGWVAPMQSMVVADRNGRIGWVAPGRVPVRGPEHDLFGQVPAPGWDARYDWQGWIPADDTPRGFAPPLGYIATANQKVTPPGYPHYITSEWAAPYRQQRIEQLMAQRDKHSLDDLARIQGDVKSLAAVVLMPHLLKAQSSHALAPAALQLLQGFDGEMKVDAAAPLIHWAWVRQLTAGVFEDDLGPELWKRTASRTWRDALEGVLARNDASWCDDRRTPAVAETCQDQVNAALTRALDELQQAHGSRPAAWRWGDAHIARSEHRPFSKVKWLAPFFETRVPVGGDTYTVNVSRVNLRPDATTGELYLDEHGPSLRALYDVADPSQSRVMHSTGQSGHPLSPHHSNWVAPWANMAYRPLWPKGPAAHSLVVEPLR